MIEKEGKGVVVYLNQEGRGIGLMEKMKAYKLQENGMDTVDANLCLGHKADERDYGVGAEILRTVGVSKMRLITNNPVKRVGLESYGLSVEENVETTNYVYPNPVKDILTITADDVKQVVMYNSLGQIVKTVDADEDNVQINVSDLQNGMYFVNIIDNAGNVTTNKVAVSK